MANPPQNGRSSPARWPLKGLLQGLLLLALALAGSAWLVERSTRERLERHVQLQAEALAAATQRLESAERPDPRLLGQALAGRDLPLLARLLGTESRDPLSRIAASLLLQAVQPGEVDVRGIGAGGELLRVERTAEGARLLAPDDELVLERGDVPTAITRTEDGRFVVAFTGGEVQEEVDGELVRRCEHAGTVHALAVGDRGLLSAGYDEVLRWLPSGEDSVRELRGHGASVQAVSWLSGERCASGDLEGVVHLWDAGAVAGTLRLGAAVRGLAHLEQEGMLAIALADGRLVLHDLDARVQESWRISERSIGRAVGGAGQLLLQPLEGEPILLLPGVLASRGLRYLELGGGPVQDLAFAPLEGGELAAASADGRLRRVDLEAGEVRASWLAHRRGAHALALAADGRLASAGADGKIRIHDGDGVELLELPAHERPVRELAWVDGGLVSIAMDGSMRYRPAPSAAAVLDRAGPRDGGVQSFALDRSGERLAWIADGGNLRVWDTRTGERLSSRRAVDLLRSSAVALEEGQLVVGTRFEEGRLSFFDAEGYRTDARGLVGVVAAVCWSPGAEVAFVASSLGVLHVFDAASGDSLAAIDTGLEVSCMATSDDGAILALGGASELALLDLSPAAAAAEPGAQASLVELLCAGGR